MAEPQAFPNPDTPIADPQTGLLSMPWFRFFATLWTRSGGGPGNESSHFLFPKTDGNKGQALISDGSTGLQTWTDLATLISQLDNDVGFITTSALSGYSTTAQTTTAIQTSLSASLSTTIPPPTTSSGSVGSSTKLARADHSHPRESGPNFVGVVSATQGFATGGVTWSAGVGAPSGARPNGSLYSNTAGGTGTRLYVSNGAGWTAVAGV